MTARRAVQASLSIILLLGASRATDARSDAATLRRYHDPVVVRTALLTDLEDRGTARYRLYARQGGAVSPIPFQFDQREGSDPIFTDQTEEPTFDMDDDDDDELVFMAKDAGDRTTLAELPRDANVAREIEVYDPVTGDRAWVYLLHFAGSPPPRSPARYASFDPILNRARALFYEITYSPGRSFFSDVRVRNDAGALDRPLITRTHITVNPTFSLLLTSWSPIFDEESFSSRIDGIRNGPVRAIRRLRQSLDLGAVFPEAPGGTVYTYFYFSSFWTPSTFSIPTLALAALEEFRFSELEDFGPDPAGIEYWDGANPEGVPFTGRSRPQLLDRDHEWWAISGPGGSCVHAFVVPPEWLEWGIARGTAFVDEAAPASGAGPSHAAGFELLHMDRLKRAGDYQMLMASVVLPDSFRPGREAEVLRMLNQPLEVWVRPVE